MRTIEKGLVAKIGFSSYIAAVIFYKENDFSEIEQSARTIDKIFISAAYAMHYLRENFQIEDIHYCHISEILSNGYYNQHKFW